MANGLEKKITFDYFSNRDILSHIIQPYCQPRVSHRCCKHGGGGLSQNMGELKMQSKNTCEGVYLIVKLPAISLQACRFTKNELLHIYFSRILGRF